MSTAIQAALAGEYAAIYAYGRAGGRRPQTKTWHCFTCPSIGPCATPCGNGCSMTMSSLPTGRRTLPGPVNSDRQARELLALVEVRLIPLYTELIAEQFEEPQRRRRAVREVRDCALRAQSWGHRASVPLADGSSCSVSAVMRHFL